MIKRGFDPFIAGLTKALASPLPGTTAHDMLAPEHRKSLLQNADLTKAQRSSVLILFYPDNDHNPTIIFTKRVEYKGVHSGQISFPGGKSELNDKDLFETAYRETEEEIGINRDKIETIGVLSELYVPPSNFIIFPVVAAMHEYPKFIPDDKEVAEIITVPFSFFLNNGAAGIYTINTHDGLSLSVPGYMINSHLIWGATAMILSELILVVKEQITYQS